ncbi:MAG: patatin-like phospholipase family protein [Candidatus Peregrinibacteria bacterium]
MPSALVLSGGGALGAAHIGVLKAVQNHYSFDTFAGVSAGAIVAAAYACGKSPEEIANILHSQNFFSLAFDFTPRNFGILRGRKILSLLEKVFEGKNFEDLLPEKQLFVGATDFSTGEQVILHSGSIAKAVRASLSIPLLFEPFFHEGKWLVDGGISQNFPVDIVLDRFPQKEIIGVDVGTALHTNMDFSKSSPFKKIAALHRSLEQTFRIFFKNQQPACFPPQVFCIRPELSSFSSAGIRTLLAIEASGYEAGENFLKKVLTGGNETL